MGKIQPKTIWLQRAEGYIEEIERDGEHTVSTFAEAATVLKRWALTAPKDGTYDKCDFKVTYADGDTYEGRFDLEYKHAQEADPLGAHMRDVVTFHAGVRCPAHMTSGKYAAFVGARPDKQIEAAKFLTTYQIGS